MKKIFFLAIFLFFKIWSVAGNLTSNITNLQCGVDTVQLNFQTDSSNNSSNAIFYWSYGFQDSSNGFGTIYEDTITFSPNLTIITEGDLLFVQVGVLVQGVYVDDGYLQFTNNVPGIFLLSSPPVTCSNICTQTYTIGFVNNNLGGTLTSGTNIYTIAPLQSSITLENVCPGSEVIFNSSNALCNTQTLSLPASQIFYGMYQASALDPNNGCNGTVLFNYQSCESIDSVSIYSFDNNGNIIFHTQYDISFDGNIQGVLSVNNLCQGSYYLSVYQNGLVVYNNFIDVVSNGYNIAIFSNLQQNNDVNYSCSGSGSLDITTNYSPFELVIYNTSNGTSDSITVDSTFYQINLNNLCQGSFYISVRLLNGNPNINYASISIINEIDIDLTTTTVNASNCSSNNGSITLNYSSLPEPLVAFATNQNGGLNYMDPIVLPPSGPFTISGFREGNNYIQITNSNFFPYFDQSFVVGVDTNNFINNYTSTITQQAGCESCIGRVLIDFNDNYNAGVYAYSNFNYTFIDNGENIEAINICSGINEIVLYSHFSSVFCVDTLNVNFNNLIVDSLNSPIVTSIVPASCNTPLSLDGAINMTDNVVRNYSWFTSDVYQLPISDSLDLFNVSSGIYKLVSYDNTSCNVQLVAVPFTDSCSMFTPYVVKDFNNNCVFDEWNNYTNREVVINPGGYIVNSYGTVNLPVGNYTATPLENPELYCIDSINFTSDANPWNNYSYVVFSDSSSYNDIELALFPGYGYESIGAYFGGFVTNNSDDTISVILKVNVPQILSNVSFNSWTTNSFQTNLFYYLSADTIMLPISIPANAQLYVEFNGTLIPGVEQGNYPVSYAIDYNDLNLTNNSVNTFITILDLFAGRNAQLNSIIVSKEVSNNGLINDLNEDIVFTFTIANNSNETVDKIFIKEQLSSILNTSSIKFVNAQNMHYMLQNDGSIVIKMTDANIEPGSIKQIQYKIRPYSNTPNGTIISSNAQFAYNHYAYKNVNATDLTVSLKEMNGISAENTTLQVWPNPAQNAIQINIEKPGSILKINDILGKTILSRQIFDNGIIQQDISNLESGIYIIEVNNGNDRMVNKLIKK